MAGCLPCIFSFRRAAQPISNTQPPTAPLIHLLYQAIDEINVELFMELLESVDSDHINLYEPGRELLLVEVLKKDLSVKEEKEMEKIRAIFMALLLKGAMVVSAFDGRSSFWIALTNKSRPGERNLAFNLFLYKERQPITAFGKASILRMAINSENIEFVKFLLEQSTESLEELIDDPFYFERMARSANAIYLNDLFITVKKSPLSMEFQEILNLLDQYEKGQQRFPAREPWLKTCVTLGSGVANTAETPAPIAGAGGEAPAQSPLLATLFNKPEARITLTNGDDTPGTTHRLSSEYAGMVALYL